MMALMSKCNLGILAILSLQVCLSLSAECSFREFFKNCKRDSPDFDDCLLYGLNKARPCLQYGDPSLNIPILEPIRYSEHTAPITDQWKMATYGSLLSVTVTLPNITEWGWANSTYTKVKSNLSKGKLVIYQEVPHKHAISTAHVSGDILGVPVDKDGRVTLDMYEVKQRYTIQRIPGSDEIKVQLVVLSTRDFKLHIYDVTTDPFVENVFNTALYRFWRLGYGTVIRFGYRLSDQAKSGLATKLFNTVDFKNLLAPSLD